LAQLMGAHAVRWLRDFERSIASSL